MDNEQVVREYMERAKREKRARSEQADSAPATAVGSTVPDVAFYSKLEIQQNLLLAEVETKLTALAGQRDMIDESIALSEYHRRQLLNQRHATRLAKRSLEDSEMD